MLPPYETHMLIGQFWPTVGWLEWSYCCNWTVSQHEELFVHVDYAGRHRYEHSGVLEFDACSNTASWRSAECHWQHGLPSLCCCSAFGDICKKLDIKQKVPITAIKASKLG